MVYLKDNIDTVRQECIDRNKPGWDYPLELIDKAIEAQVGQNLRYRNGKTYDKDGCLSQYTCSTDVPEYESDQEAAKWELTSHVRNSANRLYKGFTAI
jgi:hypothetical protein